MSTHHESIFRGESAMQTMHVHKGSWGASGSYHNSTLEDLMPKGVMNYCPMPQLEVNYSIDGRF